MIDRRERIRALDRVLLLELVAFLGRPHMETVSDRFIVVFFNLDVGLFDLIEHVLNRHMPLLRMMVRVPHVLGRFWRICSTHSYMNTQKSIKEAQIAFCSEGI